MPFQRRKEWGPRDPSDEECVQNCLSNAERCAIKAAYAKKVYDGAMPGTDVVSSAAYDVNRYRAEERHWRGLAEWHRKRIADAAKEATRLAVLRGDLEPEADSEPTAYAELGGGVAR